jgi:beta-fructofuranosidase
LECPNFIQVGDRWILLTSPYRPVEYVAGDFDIDTLTFTPQRKGVLDPGYNSLAAANFYATNTLVAPDGRCILLAWMRGFAAGRGWSGYLAVPRVLSIDEEYQPRQEPVEEINQLRGNHHATRDHALDSNAITVDRVNHASLEIQLVLDPGDAAQSGIRFVPMNGTGQPLEILFNRQVLLVDGVPAPLAWSPGERLQLRIFLDGAGLELFADEGHVGVTRVVDLPIGGMEIEVIARSGRATLHAYDRWEMKSIWERS